MAQSKCRAHKEELGRSGEIRQSPFISPREKRETLAEPPATTVKVRGLHAAELPNQKVTVIRKKQQQQCMSEVKLHAGK